MLSVNLFVMDTAMEADTLDLAGEMEKLIADYRARCLWFLRPDFRPVGMDETLRVLDLIERYGDRDAYQRARKIRTWLSQKSNATS